MSWRRAAFMLHAVLLSVSSSHVMADGEDKEESRLRFKDGPVCMCSGGLSEADIRKSEELRRTGDEGREIREDGNNKRRNEEEK